MKINTPKQFECQSNFFPQKAAPGMATGPERLNAAF